MLNEVDDGRGGDHGTSHGFLIRTNTDCGLLVPVKGGAQTLEIANAPCLLMGTIPLDSSVPATQFLLGFVELSEES